ncbi:MAG: hypothetical protein LC799_24505, partial [Actinobacteria bacterium]|nr:hypothetical protein [Actinomycetota bacterium]
MFELIVVLVAAAPLLAALANGVNALMGDRYSWRVVQRLATGAIFVSFLGTLWVVGQVLVDSTPREVVL